MFRHNQNKPATGYKKDGPRKVGTSRFLEILVRDFWDLIKLNVLFCLCALPSVALFLFGLFGFYPSITFTLSVLAAYPIGGAVTAYIFYITLMLRDEPSNVWYEFKRKFAENFKQAALTGILCTVIIYAQILLWGFLMQGGSEHELLWVFVTIFTMLLFFMITPYLFLQFAYISLGTFQILKNSVIGSFAHPIRGFMGAIFSGLMWVLFALYLPASLTLFPFIFLIGISLSMLLCLMWLWPPFNKFFKVEETLNERK